VAIEVFNKCSKIEEKYKDVNQPGKKDFFVHFDYEFLEDFQDKPDIFSRLFQTLNRYIPPAQTCKILSCFINSL